MLKWIVLSRTVYLYKLDLALNNLQRLICHKTQQTNSCAFFVFLFGGSLLGGVHIYFFHFYAFSNFFFSFLPHSYVSLSLFHSFFINTFFLFSFFSYLILSFRSFFLFFCIHSFIHSFIRVFFFDLSILYHFSGIHISYFLNISHISRSYWKRSLRVAPDDGQPTFIYIFDEN